MHDLTGVQTGVITGVDPLLEPLDDNGGDTETHALPARSAAVNAGNPAVPTGVGTACESTDQRFRLRGVGPNVGRCDIGAFERNAGAGQEGQPGASIGSPGPGLLVLAIESSAFSAGPPVPPIGAHAICEWPRRARGSGCRYRAGAGAGSGSRDAVDLLARAE